MKKLKNKHGKANTPKRKRIFWSNLAYSTIYRLADTPLPEIAFLSAFILSRWYINSDFSYPSEIWLPIILFGVMASVIYYVFRAVFGHGAAAHLAAILLTYSFYSYSFIHDSKPASIFLQIIPHKFKTDLVQSIVLGLALAILAGLVAWAIRWLITRYVFLKSLQAYKVLLFAVVFIFGWQAIKGVERYFQIHKELSYHYPAPSAAKPAGTAQKSRPDIYYILFDRYGNKQQLQKNFDYDNSDIMNFLAGKGFTNRPEAFANYPFTMSSVSSTMAMNYFPQFEQMFGSSGSWQAAFPYRDILKNPPVAQILKQNGYQYNQLSSWWDFTRVGVKADTNPDESFRLSVLGKRFYLTDLQRDMVHKSILSPWLKKGLGSALKYDLDRNPRENFEAQMTSLKDIAGHADKSGPQFSFAHILAPHPPYVFKADGSEPNYDEESNDNGVDETVKYTQEATYVNKRIKDLVNYIQQHDPGAVIFFQADEGPYPKQFRGPMSPDHFYDPLNLPLDKMQQKFGVFASYYMPGLPVDQAKQIQASVNVFPFILNNYLGYSIPMLPDCHFSTGNKYRIYNYTLVNDKLTGQTNTTSCEQYK